MSKTAGSLALQAGKAGGGRGVWLHAGLWAALILVWGLGALTYFSLQSSIRTNEAAIYARDVRSGASVVLSLLKDAETAARGYVITGSDAYLRAFAEARSQIPDALEYVTTLVAGDAKQSRTIAELGALTAQKLAAGEAVIALRRQSPETTVQLAAALDTGQRIMNEIRTLVATLVAQETRTFEQQRAATAKGTGLTTLVILLSTVTGSGVIAGIFYAMTRETRRRRAAESRVADMVGRLEEQVAERTRDLERSRGFLQTVLDSVQDALLVNKDGRIVLTNRAGLKLFGVDKPEALLGRTFFDLFHSDYHDIIRERVSIMLDRKGTVPTIEEKIVRADGRLLDVEATSSRFFDGQGDVLVALLHDISERKRTEATLRQAQRMEAVGQLSGGLAHDFNNLLVVIIGNLDLLQERLGDDRDSHELIEAMLQAAWRGADLTGQLLAFARRQILQPKLIDLNAMVKATSGLLKRTLGEHITIELRQADDLWPVMADPALLESALTNLAINARDAMTEGGRLLIETANRVLEGNYAELHRDAMPGDYVMLSVSDSGIGMSPEVLSRVFEPFFTTKSNGKGSGLGLSMVYGFVRQSQGHIQIYSEPDQGTTVRLYLPRAGDLSIPMAEEEPDAGFKGSLDILVVEDRADVRAVVCRQLRELGHRVTDTSEPQEALRVLRDGRTVDLLFTDIVLPGGMDGDELARRAEMLQPAIAVLLTSGFADATLRHDRLAGIGQRYTLLSKPYRKRDLARRIAQAVLRREIGTAAK
ncbi:MAG TPA: CHASE3 domain-containing protein [Kiloniellales bacterium]|nr:CHASE3 domain-containing protein [Kiloniellales bacterium]